MEEVVDCETVVGRDRWRKWDEGRRRRVLEVVGEGRVWVGIWE